MAKSNDGKVETHGDFTAVSVLTIKLKDDVQAAQFVLDPTTREALDQILSRVARIVCGDQAHRKHWEDVQGFCQAKLDAMAPPTASIETDIQHLVRTLPVVRVERNNG